MKLHLEEIKKSFSKNEVLKNVNFTFEQGKIYGLLGRNGAGKTTLFNILNDDLKADEGKYWIEETEKLENRVCDFGYVVSTPQVPEFLTAREFLKFFLDIHKEKIKENYSVDEYFELVKISISDRDKLLKDYSHGMKNKMQMLINIIANPKIFLLDEPLTSLDVVVAEEMKELLKSIKKEHIILFSTHIMDLALSLCDEIVLLSHGELKSIDMSELTEEKFKQKIVSILKEEDYYVE